jgi:diguanylate cyclase (GGDEF)-like protein
VLKGLGKLLKKTVRSDQMCARYGGEEFAVALPGVDAPVAARIAERIRASIESYVFKIGEGRTLRKTGSLGVAALAPGETREQLIRRADQALYAAKQGGRNRVVVAPAPAGAASDQAPAPEPAKQRGR